MRVQRVGFAVMKGTRHLTRPSVHLRTDGAVGDRVFAVADPATRRVLRTVRHPSLALVEAAVHAHRLTLRFPDGTEVSGSTDRTGPPVLGDYWGRPAPLHPLDGSLDGPVSTFLECPAAVVSVDPGRVVWGAPVSLVTTGALERLEADLRSADRDVPNELAARSRSTLTLEAAADPEPGSRLLVGEAVIEVVGPVDRCAVVDVDPLTGVRGSGLLAALSRGAGRPVFGVDARVVEAGVVRPGDLVVPQ